MRPDCMFMQKQDFSQYKCTQYIAIHLMLLKCHHIDEQIDDKKLHMMNVM